MPFDDKPFDYGAFWKATREDYLELNKASTRIKLRVNRSECDSKLILGSMTELEEIFKENLALADPAVTVVKIHKFVSALERDVPPLLKKEWERVKGGELVYRCAKIGAVVLFTVAVVSSVALVTAILLRSHR